MKQTLLLMMCWLCCQTVLAQKITGQEDRSGLLSVELGEVTVKHTDPDKFANKVRAQNVFIVLNPTQPGVVDARQDSTYFVTRFPQPEPVAILLHAVQLKLKAYDTAMFDVKLLIYQPGAQDTLRKVIVLEGGSINKKQVLTVDLLEKNIKLQQGDFYIGYGFHSKHIPELFKYRMYSSNNGAGALLTFKKGQVDIVTHPNMPYVFPFKMTYKKY
jgi:hypothetical protein